MYLDHFLHLLHVLKRKSYIYIIPKEIHSYLGDSLHLMRENQQLHSIQMEKHTLTTTALS